MAKKYINDVQLGRFLHTASKGNECVQVGIENPSGVVTITDVYGNPTDQVLQNVIFVGNLCMDDVNGGDGTSNLMLLYGEYDDTLGLPTDSSAWKAYEYNEEGGKSDVEVPLYKVIISCGADLCGACGL